jgi:beta-phosphoglucomutase family hydrolase
MMIASIARAMNASSSRRLVLTRADYDAVLLDLNGVITRTASLHAEVWKQMFDAFLRQRTFQLAEHFEPFNINEDYRRYVDGRTRADGVANFLASRGIELPYGELGDGPEAETVCGLGNRKNRLFLQKLEQDGVEVYDSSVSLVWSLRPHKFRTAVTSSSKNCRQILEAAHITDLFDAEVDGIESEKLKLKGKPAPDLFLEAARRLEVSPSRTVVLEDAMVGVEAGRRGNFACVVGVDHMGDATLLREAGADFVISDLSEIEVAAV